MTRFNHYEESKISSSYLIDLQISRSGEDAKHNVTYQLFVDEGEKPSFDFNKITNKLSRIGNVLDNTQSEIKGRQSELISFEKISREEYQGNDKIEELEHKIASLTEDIAQGETKDNKKESSNKIAI